MPIYEYKCTKCKQAIESVMCSMAEMTQSKTLDCSICQKKTKHNKLISQSSFVLKGDGWFKDGY